VHRRRLERMTATKRSVVEQESGRGNPNHACHGGSRGRERARRRTAGGGLAGRAGHAMGSSKFVILTSPVPPSIGQERAQRDWRSKRRRRWTTTEGKTPQRSLASTRRRACPIRHTWLPPTIPVRLSWVPSPPTSPRGISRSV